MPGIGRVDAAAQLRPAPPVEPVQHHLADQLAIQPDGEVHRPPGGEVLPGHGQEVILRQLPLQVLAIVITPPAVARIVQAQGVIGGLVPLLQRRQGQPGGGDGGDLPQAVRLAPDLEP